VSFLCFCSFLLQIVKEKEVINHLCMVAREEWNGECTLCCFLWLLFHIFFQEIDSVDFLLLLDRISIIPDALV